MAWMHLWDPSSQSLGLVEDNWCAQRTGWGYALGGPMTHLEMQAWRAFWAGGAFCLLGRVAGISRWAMGSGSAGI